MNKFFILIFLSILFSQETFTYTEEEVIEIESYITELEVKDSLNILIIKNLENQINNCNDINESNELLIQKKDSLTILLEDQINSYDELVKAVEIKWYDKLKWILYGVGSGLIVGILVE